MPSVAATIFGGDIKVFVYGYLIDASSLPSRATSHVDQSVTDVPGSANVGTTAGIAPTAGSAGAAPRQPTSR